MSRFLFFLFFCILRLTRTLIVSSKSDGDWDDLGGGLRRLGSCTGSVRHSSRLLLAVDSGVGDVTIRFVPSRFFQRRT